MPSVVTALSSPRKRGCFRIKGQTRTRRRVFPAQAGVFLSINQIIKAMKGLPRASGGVSQTKEKQKMTTVSSPRKRGCFSKNRGGIAAHPGLPRASGGVSPLRFFDRFQCTSSPRKRGCFQLRRRLLVGVVVFPAQAGVFQRRRAPLWITLCLPRASGGVSRPHAGLLQVPQSSPRKRGCFSTTCPIGAAGSVFPAQAGVFPTELLKGRYSRSLPRASGGVSGV